jgi:hypothetical protein
MQATTTPKLAAPFPAAQALLAAVLLAVALTVVGTIGIALQRSAPAAPNAAAQQLDGAGQRRQIVASSDAVVGASDRLLDGAAFRTSSNALTDDDFYSQVGFRRGGAALPGTIPAVRGPVFAGGHLIWLGTQPGTNGTIADDQMSSFNGVGLSKPGADETEKVGRAHR